MACLAMGDEFTYAATKVYDDVTMKDKDGRIFV